MGSLMDLDTLRSFLVRRKFKFKIGSTTPGDGNCLLHCIIQNMEYYRGRGLWRGEIPSSVNELRAKVIEYMKSRKNLYVGYTNNNGQYIDGSHTETTFDDLIKDQEKPNSYCDEEGFFVAALAQYLDVTIQIVITSIETPVIPDGTGGPIQKVNYTEDRIMFCAALLRDENRRTGHYQFIFEDNEKEEEETMTASQESVSTRGKYIDNEMCSEVILNNFIQFQFPSIPLR